MKFAHSQRELQQLKQYTPPCNYYQIAQEKTHVLTGSLAGPSLAKEQPCFGLSSRFNSIANRVPGPGAYMQEKSEQKLNAGVVNSVKLREYKKQAVFSMQDQPPSIPYQQFKYQEEDLQNIRQLLVSEDLNKSSLSTKKKSEAYTFSKSPRSAKKVKTQQPQPLQIISEEFPRLQRKDKVQVLKERLKRSNQRRAEIMNQINPEFVPSLQLVELLTKRRTKYTPGPGEYHNQRDISIRLMEHAQSFSAAQRFSEDKGMAIGPGQYELSQPKRQSISFSRSTRTLFNLKQETDLQHRFYIDPYSNIQKRENQNIKGQKQPHAFGSEVARNFTIKKEAPRLQDSYKLKKQSKLLDIVEKKLKALDHPKNKRSESQGLLGISTMASSIQ